MKLDPALKIEIDPETGAEMLPPTSRNVPPPKRGGGPRNAAKRRDVALRVDEIIRLRVMGKTWKEVALAVGYKQREAAIRAFRVYIRAIPAENAAELRAIENARYDAITAKLWPAVMQLDWDAIDRFMRLSQARRQLNGIDLEPKFVIDQAANDRSEHDGRNLERILELRSQLEQLSFEETKALLEPLLRLGLMGSSARPS